MMHNIDKEVGIRLKIARKTAGYRTSLDFANHMSIPKSTYSQHENGKRSLTAKQITNYAEILDIEASWLLTGLGHPCPQGKNKNLRKEEIESEIGRFQQTNNLPFYKNPTIDIKDGSAVINMDLFSKILTSAISMLASKHLLIQADELMDFLIHIYNNIAFLSTTSEEKYKIIELSINSMFRGNHIFQLNAENS